MHFAILKNTFCVFFFTSQLPLSVSLELDLFGHGGGRRRKAGGIIQQTNNRSATPSFLIIFSKHQHRSKLFCNSMYGFFHEVVYNLMKKSYNMHAFFRKRVTYCAQVYKHTLVQKIIRLHKRTYVTGHPVDLGCRSKGYTVVSVMEAR